MLTVEGYKASATDYLGIPLGIPRNAGDIWGNLNSSESGWGNWFGILHRCANHGIKWHRDVGVIPHISQSATVLGT